MGYDPHNIKTFIEAEEWKVLKSSVLIINKLSAECISLKAAYIRMQVVRVCSIHYVLMTSKVCSLISINVL